MTGKQFSVCWQAASRYPDAKAFISDMGRSAIWGDRPGDKPPVYRLQQLGCIWSAVHTGVRNIRKHTGLSQAAFGERFLIPARTIQDWEGGRRTPPDYIRLLLMQSVGMFSPADFGTA